MAEILSKRKYEIYRKMSKEIPEIEEKIRNTLKDKGYTVYDIFLSVADEAKRLFFADIEYGGTPATYRRIRGTFPKETLVNLTNEMCWR